MMAWLRQKGVVLVAADELLHETMQKDRDQIGLGEGQTRQQMPVLLQVTNPQHLYVRVHRREGRQRLLSLQEQQAWARQLASVARSQHGSDNEQGGINTRTVLEGAVAEYTASGTQAILLCLYATSI